MCDYERAPTPKRRELVVADHLDEVRATPAEELQVWTRLMRAGLGSLSARGDVGPLERADGASEVLDRLFIPARESEGDSRK